MDATMTMCELSPYEEHGPVKILPGHNESFKAVRHAVQGPVKQFKQSRFSLKERNNSSSVSMRRASSGQSSGKLGPKKTHLSQLIASKFSTFINAAGGK